MTQKTQDAGRPVLLLLEGDPAVRRSLQLVLQGQGFNVRAYASPAMLLAGVAPVRAICLVTGYRLAGMTGIEVLAALRGCGWAGPAILLVGHGSEKLTQQGLSSGFELVLSKPLRHFSLAKLVMRLVRNR